MATAARGSSTAAPPEAHRTIDGTWRQTNLPNESAAYLSAREELRAAEIELMRQRERAAVLRRRLPLAGDTEVRQPGRPDRRAEPAA